jgi:hypothetical protein
MPKEAVMAIVAAILMQNDRTMTDAIEIARQLLERTGSIVAREGCPECGFVEAEIRKLRPVT